MRAAGGDRLRCGGIPDRPLQAVGVGRCHPRSDASDHKGCGCEGNERGDDAAARTAGRRSLHPVSPYGAEHRARCNAFAQTYQQVYGQHECEKTRRRQLGDARQRSLDHYGDGAQFEGDDGREDRGREYPACGRPVARNRTIYGRVGHEARHCGHVDYVAPQCKESAVGEEQALKHDDRRERDERRPRTEHGA